MSIEKISEHIKTLSVLVKKAYIPTPICYFLENMSTFREIIKESEEIIKKSEEIILRESERIKDSCRPFTQEQVCNEIEQIRKLSQTDRYTLSIKLQHHSQYAHARTEEEKLFILGYWNTWEKAVEEDESQN